MMSSTHPINQLLQAGSMDHMWKEADGCRVFWSIHNVHRTFTQETVGRTITPPSMTLFKWYVLNGLSTSLCLSGTVEAPHGVSTPTETSRPHKEGEKTESSNVERQQEGVELWTWDERRPTAGRRSSPACALRARRSISRGEVELLCGHSAGVNRLLLFGFLDLCPVGRRPVVGLPARERGRLGTAPLQPRRGSGARTDPFQFSLRLSTDDTHTHTHTHSNDNGKKQKKDVKT